MIDAVADIISQCNNSDYAARCRKHIAAAIGRGADLDSIVVTINTMNDLGIAPKDWHVVVNKRLDGRLRAVPAITALGIISACKSKLDMSKAVALPNDAIFTVNTINCEIEVLKKSSAKPNFVVAVGRSGDKSAVSVEYCKDGVPLDRIAAKAYTDILRRIGHPFFATLSKMREYFKASKCSTVSTCENQQHDEYDMGFPVLF